jgi:DNA-directed RNA polymerase subunit M/transcription elongation factor TFIIS
MSTMSTMQMEVKKDLHTEQHFDLQFPDSFVLDYDTYYEDMRYNDIRRCKLLLFAQCLGQNKQLEHTKLEYEAIKNRRTITDRILYNLDVGHYSNQCINMYLYIKPFTKEYAVRKLEKGCLNRTIQKSRVHNIRCVWSEPKFVDLYHNICYKLASNLDVNSCVNSGSIKQKILNGDVKLQNVANLSSKEMCPKKYEKIDQKINKRANLDRKIKFSELYKCRKCKRNQCTTERRYARSLDEGTDLTIHCLFCGHSWLA